MSAHKKFQLKPQNWELAVDRYIHPRHATELFFLIGKKKTVVVFLTSISLRFRGPPASSASLPVHFLATDGLLCSCLQNKATWVYSYHFFFILKKKEATWLYHFFFILKKKEATWVYHFFYLKKKNRLSVPFQGTVAKIIYSKSGRKPHPIRKDGSISNSLNGFTSEVQSWKKKISNCTYI